MEENAGPRRSEVHAEGGESLGDMLNESPRPSMIGVSKAALEAQNSALLEAEKKLAESLKAQADEFAAKLKDAKVQETSLSKLASDQEAQISGDSRNAL